MQTDEIHIKLHTIYYTPEPAFDFSDSLSRFWHDQWKAEIRNRTIIILIVCGSIAVFTIGYLFGSSSKGNSNDPRYSR